MGAAARKIVHTTKPAGPTLRLVHGTRRSPRARSSARSNEVFRVAAACLLVLATAGILRVSLAASAAEASIDAWNLKAQVKAERLVSRTLESDRSALAAPSRIEAVASQTLNMAKPTQVSYLQLPTQPVTAEATVPGKDDAPSGGRLLATLVDLAAGEAQVMLVGDVGLGSPQ